MKNLKKLLRIFLAIILGELALGLLTAFVQEVLFDGISWTTSPRWELIAGGLGTMLAAMAAGYVTSLAGGRGSFRPHLGVSLLIALETTWLITTGRTTDPAWFDALAGAGLIGGIWIGRAVFEANLISAVAART